MLEMQNVQSLQDTSQTSPQALQMSIRMKRMILSCFTGLARSPNTNEEDLTLFQLFDAWWTWLSGHIQTTPIGLNGKLPTTTLSLSLFLGDSDDLLISYTYLLRDFSEHQLPRLYDDTSSAKLYSAFASLLLHYTYRLSRSSNNTGSTMSSNVTCKDKEDSNEEAIAFQSDSSLLLLDVLNHLSLKEFSLFDDTDNSEGTNSNPIGGGASVQQYFHSLAGQGGTLSLQDIPRILLFGFETMLPLIKTDILLSFPLTAERYFSFVVFLCGSHLDLLVQWLNNHTSSYQVCTMLIEQVIVGMTLTDATTARMAFQVSQYPYLSVIVYANHTLSLSLSLFIDLTTLSNATNTFPSTTSTIPQYPVH